MSFSQVPGIDVSGNDYSDNSRTGLWLLSGDVEKWAESSWNENVVGDKGTRLADDSGAFVAYGYWDDVANVLEAAGKGNPWKGAAVDEDADWKDMFANDNIPYAILYSMGNSSDNRGCLAVVADRTVAETYVAVKGLWDYSAVPVYTSRDQFQACQPSMRRQFWLRNIKRVPADFTGYQIRYCLLDFYTDEEYPVSWYRYWRSKGDYYGAADSAGRAIHSADGKRYAEESVYEGNTLTRVSYEYEIFHIVDGEYVDQWGDEGEDSVFESDAYPYGGTHIVGKRIRGQ